MNTTDLTLKQMFGISAKLVGEQDEISNLETIRWEKHSWKYLSLIGDERVINLQRAKVYVFSDSVLCLGKIHQHPNANESWKNRIEWITTSQSYRDYDGISGEPTEFEWNIFPGFDTLQLYGKVTDLLSRLGETPENFTGRILFMSMFNDISCGTKDNERECLANAKVVSIYAKKFGIGQWSFIGPGSEKKWYSMEEDSPQGIWDHIAEKMLLEFAESTCPIFRATTPLSRGKLRSKGHGKLSIHYCADQATIETIFRIIVSANQLSLYGAVANMCEEYESLHDRSGQPDKVMGQSIVLSEIKTEVPLENDDPAYQNFVLQQYEERIERLSQQDKVSKFCMDAGFLSVVEIGQYFMTKDNGEQFYAMACREYTLPRDDGSSQPRGWIQGNTKIGPVLEVTTSCLYGKHGVEIRIWSLSEDNTHSWVRISHGSNKFVMDSNNNDTEVPEDQPEEQALQLNVKDFACRSKAKAKPQRREPAGYSPSIIPMNARNWIDIEPGNHSLSAYEVSKKVIHLLRHSQQVQREEDGAVHFWRIKEHLQSQFPQIPHWSDNRWKACLAAGGGAKRRYQYCTDGSGIIVYLRALQGHSGRNLIDPSLQDNVVIQSEFFHYIYHIGCAFNLHSIINNGLIPGGQNSSKRQTVFFLLIDPRDKEHKDPEKIDLNVPRRAQYLHNAWKKHQDAVYWVDINLAIRKGLTFYQTRSNAIILQGTLPAYCIPKVVRLKTGEVLYEKAYMSPRPPPKISLRHDWTKELGSKVDRQPEGEVTRQARRRSCSTSKILPTNPTNSKSNS